MSRIGILILAMLSCPIAAGLPSFETISDSVLQTYGEIQDYEVDVKIGVKMTGFRMPGKKVKVFYKYPDKMKVKTTGFAIIPKTGFAGNPRDLLKLISNVSTITSAQSEGGSIRISGNVNADSLDIGVDVSDEELPAVKIDLIVDQDYWVITKAEVYLDAEPVFSINMDYTTVDGMRVPRQTEFVLGIKGISKWTTSDPYGGPDNDRHDFNSIAEHSGFDPKQDEIAGTIKMKFSKYKINRGIDDSIFIEED